MDKSNMYQSEDTTATQRQFMGYQMTPKKKTVLQNDAKKKNSLTCSQRLYKVHVGTQRQFMGYKMTPKKKTVLLGDSQRGPCKDVAS